MAGLILLSDLGKGQHVAQQWYYTKNGENFGPISSQQLRELAAAQSIEPTDLVWREGLASWQPASKVKGLFATSVASTDASVPPPLPTAQQLPPPLPEEAASHQSPSVLGSPDLPSNTIDHSDVTSVVKAKATVIGISIAMALVLRALFGVFSLSPWFCYWAGVCFLLPAVLWQGSMCGTTLHNLAEVLLRNLLFFIGGVLGVVGIGMIVLNMMLNIITDKDTAAAVGFVVGSLPAGLLAPNMEVLLAVAAPLMHVFNKGMTQAASDGSRCRRCEGTGYCYVCRGTGCPQCRDTGECFYCVGTGLGNSSSR